MIRSLQLLVKVCTRLRKESLDSWCENRKLTFKLSTKSSVRISYNLTQDKFYSLICRILITVFISYLYFYIVFMIFLMFINISTTINYCFLTSTFINVLNYCYLISPRCYEFIRKKISKSSTGYRYTSCLGVST